jgi:hypothetical protein
MDSKVLLERTIEKAPLERIVYIGEIEGEWQEVLESEDFEGRVISQWLDERGVRLVEITTDYERNEIGLETFTVEWDRQSLSAENVAFEIKMRRGFRS